MKVIDGLALRRNLLAVLCCLYSAALHSQGCSDAGICSAGNMMPGARNTNKSSVTMNLQYGVGEQNVRIFTPQLEGILKLDRRNFLQCKVPYVVVQGNIGRTNGLGDITAIWNRQLNDSGRNRYSLNLGFRAGVNNAAKMSSDPVLSSAISLPMPYQTSLGTHDVLIGVDCNRDEKWFMAIGLQVPVVQFNRNNFDTSKLLMTEQAGKQYFSSDHLKRRPDLILRADRVLKLNRHLSFSAGALLIYHTLHDRSINISGRESAIHGSKGATLNIPLSCAYQFSEHWRCTLRFASPVLVRKTRPDGLTRHYVVGLELKYIINMEKYPKSFKRLINPDF